MQDSLVFLLAYSSDCVPRVPIALLALNCAGSLPGDVDILVMYQGRPKYLEELQPSANTKALIFT